jgi:hypothetical protein
LAYENNYFGGNFRPNENEGLFERVIPMSPNKDNQKYTFGVRIFGRIATVLRVLNIPIILIGLTFTIISFLSKRTLFTDIVLGIYLLLIIYYLIRLFRFTERSVGAIINISNNSPVDLAIVRAISEETGKLIKATASDDKGKYIFALTKGSYRISVTKSGMEQIGKFTLRVNPSFHPTGVKIEMRKIVRSNQFGN